MTRFRLAAMIAAGALMTAGGATAAVGSVNSSATAAQAPRATQVATVSSDWPQLMFGSQHSSVNPTATAITPSSAPSLTQAWKAAIPLKSKLYATPVVYNHVVYFGTLNGVFYALNETTGAAIWTDFASAHVQSPATTCGTKTVGPFGFASTATIALGADVIGPNPTAQVPIAYVAGGDGNLYALRASDGAVEWKSLIDKPDATHDFYPWSSPVVAGGFVYQGNAVHCIAAGRGAVRQYDQTTGALRNTWFGAAVGNTGNGVWSTPAISPDGKSVFVTTANGTPCDTNCEAIDKLDAATMARVDNWKVPKSEHISDGDFGGSPTLFSAVLTGTTTPTDLIGACNKNGVYYVLKQANLAAGPVWQRQVGLPDTAGQGQCDAAAVWDGARLFVSSNGTTVAGTSAAGSVRQLNPATGSTVWETALPGPIMGTPTMDGSGVIAAGGFGSTASQDGAWLLDAANGKVLKTMSANGAPTFGQLVFADNFLLQPTYLGGLFAFK